MNTRHFFQVGYVVSDIDDAMATWMRTTGAGPFHIMRNVVPQNGRYRGKLAHLEISAAFAQSGSMQIELIQQHGTDPSVYRDAFADGAGGFHHLCYWAHNLASEIEHFRFTGAEPGYVASAGSLNFAYIDTRAQIGCFTEVLEHDAGTAAMFNQVAISAENWDGSNPVRLVG